MDAAQMIDPFLADLLAYFSQQHIGEEAARHADAAVDAPDRQIDILSLQRIMPGEHMVIDAVDKGAVEVEQESRFGNRHDLSPHPVSWQQKKHAATTHHDTG